MAQNSRRPALFRRSTGNPEIPGFRAEKDAYRTERFIRWRLQAPVRAKRRRYANRPRHRHLCRQPVGRANYPDHRRHRLFAGPETRPPRRSSDRARSTPATAARARTALAFRLSKTNRLAGTAGIILSHIPVSAPRSRRRPRLRTVCRVVSVERPFQRIVPDIFPDAIQFRVAPYDVVVKRSLPAESAVVPALSGRSGDGGLESLHDPGQTHFRAIRVSPLRL